MYMYENNKKTTEKDNVFTYPKDFVMTGEHINQPSPWLDSLLESF